MKAGKLLAVLVAASLLGGCKGFWQAPSSSSGSSGSTLSSGVFYVVNQATNEIAAYSIVSGVLTKVSGSPYTLTSSPFAIAIAPGGGFLYVATAQGIFLYTISSGGALTLANNGGVISSDLATTMQVDSTGSWLVESGPDIAQLVAIPVNQTTGVPISTIEQKANLPATTVQQLAIAPDNAHVFVALGAGGTEEVAFNSGGSDPFGNEQNFPVKNSAGAAVSVAVDPDSRLVYIGETAATSGSNAGGVRAFYYSTMTEVSGSPYASGGLGPYSILPLTNGDVYVANRTVSGSSSGNITGFSVTTSGSTYSLSALSTTATTGVQPVGMAVDSEGNYLIVVDFGGSPDLEAYTLDTTTAGKLDSALTAATGTDPTQATAIAAVP
jgi:6-phosphogluconolactonase (cycloisomerase 2 family)